MVDNLQQNQTEHSESGREQTVSSTEQEPPAPGCDTELQCDAELQCDTEDDMTEDASFDAFYQSPTVEMLTDDDPGILARLLGFLSPGTFLALSSRTIHGINLNLGLSMLFIIGPIICVLTGLFPIPIFIASAILLLACWIFGIAHVISNPPHFYRTIEPLSQAGLAFLTFWLPFLICFLVSFNSILQFTWMTNDTMQPGMQEGDTILVDKLSYRFNEPNYGDLVMVEQPYKEGNATKTRAFFGRIIAMPGDRVQLFGLHPQVNGKNLPQYHAQSDRDVFDRPITTYELPAHRRDPSDPNIEPENWYMVLAPNQLLFSQTNLVTLEKDYYFILEDNRDAHHERIRTSYGSIILRSEIRGRPRYVIYNSDIEHPLDRYGIALR